MGHPQRVNLNVWVGAGGEMGKSAYKLMFQFIFRLHAFLYEDAGTDP